MIIGKNSIQKLGNLENQTFAEIKGLTISEAFTRLITCFQLSIFYNLLTFLLCYSCSQMVLFMLMLGSIPYWVQYILKREANVEIFISGAFLLGSIISVPIWVKLGRKMGNRKVYIIGSGVSAILFVPMMFISTIGATIIGTIFLGIALGALWTLMYPCFSDVIDEIVVKTGARKEGIYTGIRTFFGRFSNIIGAIVIAGVHIATGFVADAPSQTPLAEFGVRVIMALVPMCFYIASCILMWKVYDLTPVRLQKIQNLLKEQNL